jgi:hypothetical protein
VHWSVDAGAPLPTTTPSGNDCASRKTGTGRTPLRDRISNPPASSLHSMTQMTKEWATRR